MLSGLGVSSGIVKGKVRIICNENDLEKIKKDEIVVARRITMPWWPYLRKSRAIISEMGGMTSHPSIIARELHIPCIVGVKKATSKLVNGNKIQVDGSTGEIVIFD